VILQFVAKAVLKALSGARRKPLIQAVAVGTIAASLVLVGAVELCARNVGRLRESWGGNVQMTVYLEDGLSSARVQQIADALGHLPGVTAVHAVDPHEAYERLRRSLGPRGDLLAGVEEGYLPASLEVSLKPGVAQMIRVHPAFERLRHAAGVEDVDLLGDFGERLEAAERLLGQLGLGVGLLVASACLYIVASTIRLGVFARRDEIEILKLVGATDRFVKAPFLIEGALQGALGTLIAGGLLLALFRLIQPRVESVLSGFVASSALAFFPGHLLLAATLGGALLGLCGSALALGRYVRV
jgi:cell division transport system permease protein